MSPSIETSRQSRSSHPSERADRGEEADVVVIGSGFGGAMAAWSLVERGLDVLMLERGGWVERGETSRDLSLAWKDRPHFSTRTPYHAETESGRSRVGSFHCVGGASIYFGGAAFRLRPGDLEGSPEVTGGVGWPFGYDTLEPWYERAERLLGVSGDTSHDPTDPPRSRDLPPPCSGLSPTALRLRQVARDSGMSPFRLPLALNENGNRPGSRCVACGTCDGFACFIGAKNDVATVVIPDLIRAGMRLRPETVVRGFRRDADRITSVEAVDRITGRTLSFRAKRFVLAAGALATPHLLLASKLDRVNPAGDAVGRYLMRHCNGIVAGPAPSPYGHPDDFRKQIGIHDFYFGDPEAPELGPKLGGIQQIRATRVGLAELSLPRWLARAVQPHVDRTFALLAIAEDQPDRDNRVRVDPDHLDAFGLPRAHIEHRHTSRDREARDALMGRARRLVLDMGAPFCIQKSLTTFSHALGTVRMGLDELEFPVAPDGRFRGTSNLFVSDASVFPTSGGVNPSLTIAANALRIGGEVADTLGRSSTGSAIPARPEERVAPPGDLSR